MPWSLSFEISDASTLMTKLDFLCSELLVCDRRGCAHMSARATKSNERQNCQNSCNMCFAVPLEVAFCCATHDAQ